ncbi:hypothetical protein [Flavobacterium terrisoli]|uniref:hypothetical protein n=1 Tax=Flavobacterium terrisoli TaxID=3242195 RepID=UPI0025430A5F|nr:hypothetical protein [Flavobacterium buctense]
MKNVIREKRRLTFGYKRITPLTIRAFSNIIESEIQDLKSQNIDNYYVMYSVDATDNTSFESQSNEIFSESQVIENRAVRKIGMHFYTLDNSKNIEIQIIHSVQNENSENFILVSGDYSNWVNGVLTRLSEIIALAENQPKIKDKTGYVMLFICVLFNVVYFKFFYNFFVENNTNEFLGIFLIAGVPILSLILLNKLFAYFDNLWPSVELQTGPNYLQKPKENRRKAYIIIFSIITPLVLRLLYDLMK